MRGVVHKFLLWLPGSLGAGAVAVAAVWEEAKNWITQQVIWGWAQMSNPWIAAAVIFAVCAYIFAIIWTGRDIPGPVAAPFAPPPMPALTPAEAVIYERTRLAQMRAEEQRALDAEEQARSSREFHRALDAYAQFEKRAPPPMPSVGQAHLGTPGAAIFGIDAAESFVAIDIQNFGQTPAKDVTYKTLTGWFAKQPSEPIPYESEGGLGITDPGHLQHIKLILKGSVTSALIRRVVRGGEGFYVLARLDYTTENGRRKRRSIAYYLDPQGQQLPDRWMLNVCPTGNNEVDIGMDDKSGITHNVTSYGQTGGITAHTVNVARRPPRSLEDGMKAELLQKVPRDKPVSVEAVLGDQEAIHLAQHIMLFLRESGYRFQNEVVIAAAFAGPVTGILLEPNGPGMRLIVGANE